MLIKPNQLIHRSYLQNFNFAWCVNGYFRGEECSQDLAILQVQRTPGLAGGEENSKHGGIKDFPEFPPREWGVSEEKVRGLCIQKLHSLTEGNQPCSSRALTAPLRPSFSASSKAILCCKSCKPTLLIPVDSASLFTSSIDTIKENQTL